MQSCVIDALGHVKITRTCRVLDNLTRPMFAVRLQRAEKIVAERFGVGPEDFYSRSRGRKSSADARQIMMYLAHVAFGLTHGEVGRLYNRDRSTVRYACRKYEDLRDDPEQDRMLERLESAISAGEQGSAASPGECATHLRSCACGGGL